MCSTGIGVFFVNLPGVFIIRQVNKNKMYPERVSIIIFTPLTANTKPERGIISP
jgi:hypothetical protein